jgi:hypothetical protein
MLETIEKDKTKLNWVETNSWIWASIIFFLYKMIAQNKNQASFKCHRHKEKEYAYFDFNKNIHYYFNKESLP